MDGGHTVTLLMLVVTRRNSVPRRLDNIDDGGIAVDWPIRTISGRLTQQNLDKTSIY